MDDVLTVRMDTPYFLNQQHLTHTLRLTVNVTSSGKYSLISPNRNNCTVYSKCFIHTFIETCITLYTIWLYSASPARM